MDKRDYLIIGALFFITGIVLYLRFCWIDHSTTMQWGYVNSGAVNPYYGVNRPYGYRLLMSIILNIYGHIPKPDWLGGIPKPGEAYIPVTFAIGLCLTFYVFLRGLRFDWPLAFLGSVLLSCSNGMDDLIKDFGINNTDTSSHILILASCWAMAAGRDSLFSAFTLIGVFNREWALVMLPTWYLFHYGFSVSKSSMIRLVRVSIPSILVYVFIRYVYYPNTALGVMADELRTLLPPTESATWAYYWYELQQSNLVTFWSRICSMQFYEFGLMGLLPFAVAGFIRVSTSWKRAIIFYGALCVLQLYFTTDVWRLAFYTFPIIWGLYLVWFKSKISEMSNQYSILFCGGMSLIVILLQHSLWLLLISCLIVVLIEFRNYPGNGRPNK